MLIPSIDIMDGNAVQLVGGKEKKIDGGDPFVWARRFAPVGEVAVIDLDAALGQGSNRALIVELCKVARCRVGGGIRSVEDALFWLNAGAEKIILGTAATPEILEALPRDRVIVALDCVDDEVVVKGWTEKTGVSVYDRMEELSQFASSFLVTFVEREGRLVGLDDQRSKMLAELAGVASLTIAGGISSADEVASLDRLGVDAQVGMALYERRFSEADCLWAIAQTDRPDGLVPTVVCDARGTALGLCYSSANSLSVALEERRGVYESRSRGLWRKGETSGATQQLLRVDLDCDRDTFRFVVQQSGCGFCHEETCTCWGDANGLSRLERTIRRRAESEGIGSYTSSLLANDALLGAKIVEEAEELSAMDADVVWEAADLFYFAMVKLIGSGVGLAEVERELDRRSLGVKVAEDSSPETDQILSERRFDQEPATGIDKSVRRSAEQIVDDVAVRGDAAVRFWSERFGDLAPEESFVFDRAAIESRARVDERTLDLLRRTRDRIATFATAQLEALSEVSLERDGLTMGHTIVPVDAAGCYAPGGRYPLPSSVLMTAVTARVAGVSRVVVASPNPTPETFAAAMVAGADSLLSIGGPQAIGAFAFGTESVDAVDVIVGPGNKYVTAAKKYVMGRVGIDMLAGPSELVVVADRSSDPEVVAADLIAQAEHDPDARPILVTTDAELGIRVRESVIEQLASVDTVEVARRSLTENGRVFVATSLEDAARMCNAIAPEHLEVLVEDSESFSAMLRHYGGLFVGSGAAEVFGDYGVGPNHVLPTGGSSRFGSGLSVYDFLKTPTFLSGSPSNAWVEDVVSFAGLERLTGHARSAALRGS